MRFLNLYLHPEKLHGLFGTVARKDWRKSISSLCVRGTHREDRDLKYLSPQGSAVGRRQFGLSCCSLQPPGNLSP